MGDGRGEESAGRLTALLAAVAEGLRDSYVVALGDKEEGGERIT